ncbi:nucleotidyltransferase domain-containing protein [Candidatus Pacearchaeota archaeon]|nr:nucleotidyltransferase domain-containing protein [Candidatus Pacearchaeota archaeon]
MTKRIGEILKIVFEKINPSKEEAYLIKCIIDNFRKKIGKKIKELKIKADVFIGGSFAKKTMIKKDVYDIDVFIRFDKKHENISELTRKILGNFRKKEVKGSRNYFIIDKGHFFIEIVPVLKINNPRKAENVMDLSYSHVNYIKKRIKNPKILDEIKLAKAFCHANGCYGAESYVRGFSGYAIELLVYHYGSFLKFIKAFEKIRVKEVIDIEKHFKNKNDVFMDLNESKLHSPIILVDPTFKSRNALAALSNETFEKFKKACSEFLRNPSGKFFEPRVLNLDKIKAQAKKKKFDFVVLNAMTDRQEGDIAGAKLLKFYNHLTSEIDRFFEVKARGFEYKKGKSARYFFAAKRKKEVILSGPLIKQEENVRDFRKKHKNIFYKSGKVYAREKINFDLKEFLKDWERKNRGKIREMGVVGMKILG